MKRKFAASAAVAALILGMASLSEAAKAPKKEYAGSQLCKKCHKEEYKSWKDSYHSKMVIKKDDGVLKGVVEKWDTDGKNQGPKKGNVTGKDYKLDDVVYVVGTKWKQRFLVKDYTTKGYQFLDKQYNSINGTWEKYGNKNDWDTMCVTCHSTGYKIVKYDPKNPKDQKVEWSELNVGCEACHGPGAKHIKSKSKKDIYSFAGKSKAEQSKVCGYCHIRGENENFKSAQGNDREDLPAPKIGTSYKPGEDWTKWYPEHVVIPGVQPEDKTDADYKGDLKGLFIKTEAGKAAGNYPAAKHHQQYQEFLTSKHATADIAGCVDCHGGLHGGKGKPAKKADNCSSCHDASYTVEKYMPGTGKTAGENYVRSHTFNKQNAEVKSGAVIKEAPVYNKK